MEIKEELQKNIDDIGKLLDMIGQQVNAQYSIENPDWGDIGDLKRIKSHLMEMKNLFPFSTEEMQKILDEIEN